MAFHFVAAPFNFPRPDSRTFGPEHMGKKRTAEDLEKLRAVQNSLKQKMVAEAASTSGAASSTEMPPPKVPKKSKKEKKEKKGKKDKNETEPANETDGDASAETAEAAAPAASAVAANPPENGKLKRFRHVGGDGDDEESRPKANAKSNAKSPSGPSEPPFDIT